MANLYPLQPSQSSIKSICYPSLFSATTKATVPGIKYESKAVRAYAEGMCVCVFCLYIRFLALNKKTCVARRSEPLIPIFINRLSTH